MSKEERLQPLIQAVRDGDIPPVEADRLGEGLGLTPFEGQDWPASFDDPQWPLALAILWIAWRERERLAKEWSRFRFWSGHIWRDPVSENQLFALDDAEASMLRKLQDGSVRAKGQPGQTPEYEDIPTIQWLNLIWMPGFSKISVRNFAHPDPKYRCVLVDRSDVLKLWPEQIIQASVLTPPRPPSPVAPRDLEAFVRETMIRERLPEKQARMRAVAHFEPRRFSETLWRSAWSQAPNKLARGEKPKSDEG